MSEFRICPQCSHIRSQADMRGQRCVYCLPRLGSAPLPAGFRVKPMSEPEDAVERVLRQIGEAK